MDIIIKFVIVLICFAAYSLLLWLLGRWSRRSIIAKIVSAIIIIVSLIALAVAYFVRLDIGTVSLSVNKGMVKTIEEIDLSADIKLVKYNQKGDLLFLYDTQGRSFFTSIPTNITGIGIKSALFPTKSFLLSFFFMIVNISNLYIIVTWGKLIAFITSFFALIYVWGTGLEGGFAFLKPSSD